MEDQSKLLQELQIPRDERDQQRSPKSVYIAIIAILAGSGLAGGFWYAKETSAPIVEQTVVTSSPSTYVNEPIGTSTSVLDATGYVTARRQATVSSRITGRVASVLIEEGESVVRGQLLATLDDRLLRAQQELGARKLDAAKAGLLVLGVARREALLALGRTEQLSERQLASQSDLDASLLRLESVQAQMMHAEKDVAVVESSLRLQAEQLSESEIRAPFAGVVINKAAQPGEIVSPMSTGSGFTRTGICSIVDMNSLEIEVDVNEANINRVTAGQPVIARLNSYPNWEIPAEVITVIPTADRNRATVRVRIRFKETDERILPDMGVRVSFLEKDNPVNQGDPQ